MRRRSRRLGPLQLRNRALGALAAAAIVAGVSGYLSSTGHRGWSSVLMVAALALAVTGSALYARAADLLTSFDLAGVRKLSGFLLGGGICAGLLGCILASAISKEALGGFGRALSFTVLVAGLGSGLAGLLTLVWVYGTPYAADRIDRISDEDW